MVRIISTVYQSDGDHKLIGLITEGLVNDTHLKERNFFLSIYELNYLLSALSGKGHHDS